jgi:hypothetical protein
MPPGAPTAPKKSPLRSLGIRPGPRPDIHPLSGQVNYATSKSVNTGMIFPARPPLHSMARGLWSLINVMLSSRHQRTCTSIFAYHRGVACGPFDCAEMGWVQRRPSETNMRRGERVQSSKWLQSAEWPWASSLQDHYARWICPSEYEDQGISSDNFRHYT